TISTVSLHLLSFSDTSSSHTYSLSVHDALPICPTVSSERSASARGHAAGPSPARTRRRRAAARAGTTRRSGERTARSPARRRTRSEEYTSELQSHLNLVCRLLLEKKNSLTLRLK